MEKKKISREGFEVLQKELQRLVTVERPAIAEKLKEARSYGDLSENAEYDEARREQQDTEMRIKELEDAIANAVIVEDGAILLLFHRSGGADRRTGRVLAMVAAERKGHPPHLPSGKIFPNPRPAENRSHRQMVPVLAGHLAGGTADTGGGVI